MYHVRYLFYIYFVHKNKPSCHENHRYQSVSVFFICFFLNNDLNIPSIQVHFLPQRNDKEKIP